MTVALLCGTLCVTSTYYVFVLTVSLCSVGVFLVLNTLSYDARSVIDLLDCITQKFSLNTCLLYEARFG